MQALAHFTPSLSLEFIQCAGGDNYNVDIDSPHLQHQLHSSVMVVCSAPGAFPLHLHLHKKHKL
jgi:hypothetical protein